MLKADEAFQDGAESIAHLFTHGFVGFACAIRADSGGKVGMKVRCYRNTYHCITYAENGSGQV